VAPLAAASPPRAEARTAARGARRPWIGPLGILVGICLALGAAGSLAAPWLSQLEVQAAARIWPAAPRRAYARLDEAARLNPLSDEPYLVAGGIALRFGDLARADHEFSLALSRNHNGAYATLERGAIASIRGERQLALRLLRRALRLDPRNPLAREALARAQHGGRVDLQRLNRSLLRKAQQLL
jgi:tetratricopeptide (TPR) repeat protein